jgi:oxygen-dependent protoporphyrinogen oxidase
MPVDAVIVGGGIAGLAAAYELSRHGVSFVVMESAARPGGVILSEQVDGFTIDAGPDALLTQKRDGIALCEELGLGERLVPTTPPRLAYIQRGGRLHALPAASVLGIPTRVGPFVKTGLFSWPGKMRMAAEILVPARRDDEDESIGGFMTRRFGREATEYLAEPLLAGIHAGDVDKLSLKSLFPRFVEAEQKHGSLLRAFSSGPAPSPDGVFRSLPGGLSELVCALTKTIGTANVRTSAPVDAVQGRGPFTVRTLAGDAVESRAVVLATPAHATSRLLRERDPELGDLCGGISYASVATVALAFPRNAIAHPLNGSGYVVPRVEQNGILAASWLSSKWPHRAPAGFALVRAFVGGARDPQAIDDDDRALVSRSLTALRPVLGVSGDPLFSRVYRWTRANAQHEVGHQTRVAAIERALARHPGLFLTGSGFRGTGIPDCVADGRATARAVAGWLQQTTRA